MCKQTVNIQRIGLHCGWTLPNPTPYFHHVHTLLNHRSQADLGHAEGPALTNHIDTINAAQQHARSRRGAYASGKTTCELVSITLRV